MDLIFCEFYLRLRSILLFDANMIHADKSAPYILPASDSCDTRRQIAQCQKEKSRGSVRAILIQYTDSECYIAKGAFFRK